VRPTSILPLLALAACGGSSPSSTTTTPDTSGATGPRRSLAVRDGFEGEALDDCGDFRTSLAFMEIPVLGGRLRVPMPEGTISSARPQSIMAADAADERETRLLLGHEGTSRVVVFVAETFAVADASLAEAAGRLEAERVETGYVARVRLASGMDAVVAEPTSLGGPPGGVMIANAYVPMPEGTVVSVGVYVTPELAPRPEACRALSRRILSGIALGDARLATSAGERALGDHLALTVPDRHAVTRDEGPDFVVHHVHALTGLEDPPATLGIYVGHHPSFEATGSASDVTILGRTVQLYRNEENGTVQLDALVPLGEHDVVHVFITAGTAARADALAEIARTLRIAP
jgi:hypothetical protein